MQHIHDDSGSDWGSIVSIASFPRQHNNNEESKYNKEKVVTQAE